MDRGDHSDAVTCQLCGETFILPEDDVDGNLPRMLLCSHIYCTSCLLAIECNSIIICPECKVESSLPEGGVHGLQEDSRIIGLIYTAKMNKKKNLRCDRFRRRSKLLSSTESNGKPEDMEKPVDIEKIEKMVDEALAMAAENLAQLEHRHETLTNSLAEQVKMESTRLAMEIKQAADEAVHAIQKWKDLQLNQLTTLEEKLSTSHPEVHHVQERMKALEIAMQMAREVRRVPFLEQYCTLDKVLETLQAPVENHPFDMKCNAMGSGISCVFQSESLNESLVLSLKMEVGYPKPNARWRPAEGRNRSQLSHNSSPTKQKQDQKRLGINSPSSQQTFPSPKPRHRSNLPQHSSASDPGTADVIVEELLDEGQAHAALPPTGPELANDKSRRGRGKGLVSGTSRRNVTQWVVVTHVVNPSHFYIRYVAEKRESEILSKKIYDLCCRNSCCFSSSDRVETGAAIFAKWKEGQWYRATVVEVFQYACREAVKTCPVTQLARVRVFFFDYGLTKTITIQSEEGTSLKCVHNHLKKMDEKVKAALGQFVPQAIRCSLKDLVPYDPTKGWSKEAQIEFQSVVGTAAVEMRPLGQDGDSLLVDLRKAPMDQSSDVPISVMEYLVFIEVARFYSPVTLDRRPLLYYPPNYPRINTQLNAVVSHINNPADFYIQLVDNMEFVLLSARLQESYNATTAAEEDALRVYCPVIGQACVARFEDKLWYRAQVIGHPGNRKVEVRYVDFGNKNILSVGDLRKIKEEFFALRSMAIHCCLLDVLPLDGQTWSDACTNRLISLAHQKLVTLVATGKVPKHEPLPVKLYESALDGPGENIAELLVKEELACFKEGVKSKDPSPPGDESAIWDPPLEPGSVTEGLDAPNQNVNGEEDEKTLDIQPQLNINGNLKDLRVRVSHVNSPSSFYVQFAQHDSHLKSICKLLKKECAIMEPQEVVWKADMYCAAHINGVWDRGQICTDVTSSNIAEVIRCDHGNKVKLHVSNLLPLPPSLMGSLALECTLTDIRPAGGRSTWTATACDFLSCYLTGASAVMTIKELKDERPVPVTLSCSNKMGELISIADFLASEGLALRERKPKSVESNIQKSNETDAKSPVSEAQPDGSNGEKKNTPPTLNSTTPSSFGSASTMPKPAPRTILTAEKVKTGVYLPPELPCLGHIKMTVSAVGDDGLIYARTQNTECHLEQLRERIHQSMKTLPRLKSYTWKFVMGCAVIGPDMLWYRGQLLEVLGGHVKVQYVDYGLEENIPVVHVYPKLLCDDIPQLCMPCHLHHINPVGGKWQRDAVELLRELLLNRCVDMQVMELPVDPRGPLTVEVFLDGLNLNKILCYYDHASVEGIASPQKFREHTVPSVAPFLDDWDITPEGLMSSEEPVLGPFIYPNLPEEGEQFKVRVKHLRTPNELFLWPLDGSADVEVDGETLDEALTRINRDINSLPRLTSFLQDSPCLAEYSDGKYYRAMLIKFISVEPIRILVKHVDFGSDDTLPTSKLRQIPVTLLQFPSRALKVRVAGFKAPSINREKEVLPYSPEWSVKAAMEMIDLLHSNITASVVAQKPELTVLLYQEDGKLIHLPLVSSGLAELE